MSSANVNLNSRQALLVRLEDQAVLLDIRSNEKMYPASLTKIMTAIIAIENLSSLEDTVLLENEVFSYIYTCDASVAGFQPLEKVRAIDLLYGALLPSGAECSIGHADYICGSEKEFVKLMNKKAMEIGMYDTHFENVTGLHNDNHYSTVNDVALMLQYALKSDTFRRIFTTRRYSTSGTNIHPDGITFQSTMFRRMDILTFNGITIVGGKTGYTNLAGQCLASLAQKDGESYILVTAGAAGTPQTEQLHIADAYKAYKSCLYN